MTSLVFLSPVREDAGTENLKQLASESHSGPVAELGFPAQGPGS